MIDINKTLLSFLEESKKAGYESFLVGGYIRDCLLGIISTDYDIASTLPLKEIVKLIPNCKVLKLNDEFFSAKIDYMGCLIELTNLRIEGPYKKAGYPTKLKYTNDIYEDLKRRDFTINAIAYSPFIGIIDPYQGQLDLKNKTIKTIKDPFDSYKEDPTRILRAFRFSFKLGFTINKKDLDAIIENKHLLKKLSKHQLQKELNKFSIKDIERLKKIEII